MPYLCRCGHKSVALGAVDRLLIPLLSRRLLDEPNARSSHRLPTPRGGGVAFVMVGSIAVAWLGSWLPLLCLPLALVGFLDDRHNLPAAMRYGVQVVTALVLVLISPWHLPLIGLLPWLLLLIAGTAIINFTNFMDGLNGLAAGCMAGSVLGCCHYRHARPLAPGGSSARFFALELESSKSLHG